MNGSWKAAGESFSRKNNQLMFARHSAWFGQQMVSSGREHAGQDAYCHATSIESSVSSNRKAAVVYIADSPKSLCRVSMWITEHKGKALPWSLSRVNMLVQYSYPLN
ncbi:hypothetical protein PC116_g28405 [Phytophthora cactorum]|uniref:Uncharacterized protein n=1 Tax=Phytophthora cactorum TaxID=29920 RepID=A0A8T1AJK4_9STRA|nr:hypothetical protein PC114_g26648 [Phytophthora cactorum]KAG2880579.1 hypothetical protein PC117_g26530 [Phytophthora cactorum]KAG2960580.1 hypothetical protein PC119_g26351 [Phytophthora cactorum]KAG3123575.1 hypothetical protein C6341_g26503 [Phytophthora cactorum]KAG4037753.1 hypothetical protein PC123_g26681 [Phytophthora cactorum]